MANVSFIPRSNPAKTPIAFPTLSQELRRLFEAQPEMSRADLAHAIGASGTLIGNLLTGTHAVSTDLLRRVAEALGGSFDTLLRLKDGDRREWYLKNQQSRSEAAPPAEWAQLTPEQKAAIAAQIRAFTNPTKPAEKAPTAKPTSRRLRVV